MKTFAPNYYSRFHCIADKCRHSCCIGWEIDIDEKTLAVYQNTPGPFGDRLKANISQGEDAHFILGNQERCPFLNEQNLCDIYTELGEENLCGICTDHPRFRNFFDNRTEIGLGMCCEAAAELILRFEDKVQITCTETGEKASFFPERTQVFAILQNREIPVDNRIQIIKKEFGISLPKKTFSQWLEVYLSLEILDKEWELLLKKPPVSPPDFKEEVWQIVIEQLLVYFVFRYMHKGIENDNIPAYLAFCLLSTEIIRRLCNTETDIFEVARMYSQEIEYCEENVDELMFEIEIG